MMGWKEDIRWKEGGYQWQEKKWRKELGQQQNKEISK